MRLLFSLFLIGLIGLNLAPTPALAQSPLDTATLGEADAIMTAMRSANSDTRPQLLTRLNKLESTSGLSQPCKSVLIRMQAIAFLFIPPDKLAETTEEMRSSLKTGIDVQTAELTRQRKACLQPAPLQQNPQDSSPPETGPGRAGAATGTTIGRCTLCKDKDCQHTQLVPCDNESFAEDDTVSIHSRLYALDDRLSTASNTKDEAALERLEAVFDRIGKNAKHEFNCRMAAGALKEVAGNALSRIRAKADGGKKKDPAHVLAAIILAKSFLDDCK